MKKALIYVRDISAIFKRSICLMLVLLVCLTLAPVAQAEDVNYSAVCKLSPLANTYNTGDTIQFSLLAQYATPGDATKPKHVTFSIPIPDVTPAVQLPMFNLKLVGSGDYEGVPMYPITEENRTINLYLMTGETGKRWIEFTLPAGSTIHGMLSMIVPNGGSQPIPEFTLTPTIISEGDYGKNVLLESGVAAVNAKFGWSDVVKTASTNNVGEIGSSTEGLDRIDYVITAESTANALRAGSIYTDHYVLTDTLALSGLHFADGELSSAEKDGVSTFSVEGTPLLEIAAPLSALNVKKVLKDGAVAGFEIIYTVKNTSLNDPEKTDAELENLSLSASLLLSSLELNPGTEDTFIKNDAVFDAYSPFGEHVNSTDSHTAYTQDRYQLSKEAFADEACTKPATTVDNGDFLYYKIVAHNNGASNGPFKLVDVLPAGLSYEGATGNATLDGQAVIWDNLLIPSGSSCSFVLKTKFDASALTDLGDLRNTVQLCADDRVLVGAGAVTPFLTGDSTSSDITYEKRADKTSAGVNDPLTYTIKVNNANKTSAKLITVTDKWPGEGIVPTSVSGCEIFKLLDESDREYTIEEVTANPSIIIKKIKCYNVLVPAGGTTEIKITGKITKVFDQMVNSIEAGPGAAGSLEAKTYGVRIEKTANAFDEETSVVGNVLTDRTPVSVGNTVCYIMTVTNLKETKVTIDSLTDKLPTSMTMQPVSFKGANSSVFLERNKTFSPLGVKGDSKTNYQTTDAFDLSAGESVRIYLFAKLTDASIANGTASTARIINYAYVSFNDVQTGDASANIYVYRNNTRTLYINKYFKFVADFNDNLEYEGTWLQYPDGGDVPAGNNTAVTATVWNGAYVGYQVQIKNTSALELGNVDLYEVVDSLPDGMEFVGVAYNGERSAFDNLTTAGDPDLTGDLIFAGQTGVWKSGIYESYVAVEYDKDARQVHIRFIRGDGSSSTLPVLPSGATTVTNEYKPFFLIVARVSENSGYASYKNTVEAKVDNDVGAYDSTVTTRSDGEYNYLSSSCVGNTIEMRPGILKHFVGHFFPGAETLDTSSSVNPGESLRYEIHVKNQGVSDVLNAENANYRDFTVTDILPPQFVYSPGSATVELNATYDTTTGDKKAAGTSVIGKGNFEPTVENLEDGGTKLTWTFSGVNMRLKSSLVSSGIGFSHIITYDTDWNNEYPLVYGNYSNIAFFNLSESERFTSISTGKLEDGGNIISSDTVVSVFGAVGTTAIETVTNYEDSTSSITTDKTIPVDGPGSDVQYTLEVSNTAANTQVSQMQSLVIINELSRAEGDTGVVNRIERGSEFSVHLDDDPNVTVTKKVNGTEQVIPESVYEVTYGESVGSLSSTGDWTVNGTGNRVDWDDSSEGKNALRVAFDPDYAFSTGETILVKFTAVAGSDADVGETARNSFGYAYQAVSNSGEVSEKFYAEPESVGITVSGAILNVKKVVEGDLAPAGDEFTFILKKGNTAASGVTYYIDNGATAYATDSAGHFKIKAGETAKMDIDSTSEYTVEEDKLPKNYTFKDFSKEQSTAENGATSIFLTCTNTYKAQYGELSLSKKVAGELASKDASWHFNVTFSDGGTYSYTGSDEGTLKSGGTVILKDGQSIVFSNIPVGTKYTVTEQEANTNGYSTSSKNSSGTIKEGRTEVVYKNYKSKIPLMGDSSDLLLWSAALMASAGVLLTVFLVRRKKHSKG